MPLYIADYLADTAHLRAAQSGAYLHLIMHYWQKGSLPDDDAQLAMIARMAIDEWSLNKSVLAAFFDTSWRHRRIEKELVTAREKYERRAAAGREGGKARSRPKQCSSNASALLNQPHLQTQSTIDGGGGDARAREPSKIRLTQQALDFADEIAKIAGHDLEFLPPRWISDAPAMRVQMMLDGGWLIPTMRDVARAMMRKKRDGPAATIRYFEAAFARAHAKQLPLPITRPIASNIVEIDHGRNPSPSDWRARKDAGFAALTKLRERIERDSESGGGEGGR